MAAATTSPGTEPSGIVDVGAAEAVPVSTSVTPSGIEIAYYVEPKRKYELRAPKGKFLTNFEDVSVWNEVPSVTTILEVLDKPALPWWGMTVGVEGVIALIKEGRFAIIEGQPAVIGADGVAYHAIKENVVPLLTEYKLTTNHVKDEAGNRGQSCHDALEAWAITGALPKPEDYPDEERPYIRSLLQFLLDCGGALEPEKVEIMVGSVEHGFAGRYDFRGKFTKDCRLVATALTQKNEPFKRASAIKHTVVPAGTRVLLDLKTSKGVYPAHLLQLEAYEGAGIEDGYDDTDARAVIHATMHGLYEFKRARGEFKNFLAVLATYHAYNATVEALK